MSKSKFYDKIVVAKEEREVEDVYNELPGTKRTLRTLPEPISATLH